MPRPAAIAATCLAAALAGCGNERTPPPDVAAPHSPGALVERTYGDGVRLLVPASWKQRPGAPPLVTTVESGRATVAVWHYPRSEPLPVGEGELRRARRALIAEVRSRDASFRLLGSRLLRIGRARGIELRGTQTIAGQRRAVRSTHVFARTSEVVVDALAPPGDFARLDRAVFRPLIASLRVRAPKPPGKPGT